MKKGKRIRHAFHNEEVCKLLHTHDKYHDWVITTAFYTAIHFVSFKIFPIREQSESGEHYELKTLDEFHRFKALDVSKHQALADLVYEYYPDISPDYDWLMSLCNTARYQNYQQSKDDAKRAVDLLATIRTSLDITDDVT
jgi:hypothetical protein